MEEDLQKPFTDCVYFLASPLTCKNGVNCEFRHSDIARLNPRDCWYWLAGGCVNPTCGFRHPPLEGRSETSSESGVNVNMNVKKSNVPCYFFFNGFCNKGDKCPFIHGPDDNNNNVTTTLKSSTTNPDEAEKKKTSVSSDTGSTPINPNNIKSLEKNEVEIQVKRDSSPHISETCSDSPLAINGKSRTSSIDGEDWLESSPGFDVLVDDKSEDEHEHEHVHEYLHDHDRDRYYEDKTPYPSQINGYDYLIGEPMVMDRPRESVLDRIYPQKFNISRDDTDLRNVLERRRMSRNGRRDSGNSRSRHNNKRREKSQQSKVKQVSASRKRSFNDNEDYTMFSGPKTLEQIKQEKKAKGNGNGIAKQDIKSQEEEFNGPKTLNQILNEKRRLVKD